MAKISVNISDELKQDIILAAKKEDRDMSWIIRKAIEEYLKEKKENE